MKKSEKLRAERSKLIHDARGYINEKQKPDSVETAEERARYDAMWKDVERLEGEIRQAEEDEKRTTQIEQWESEEARSAVETTEKETAGDPKKKAEEQRHAAFNRYLRSGTVAPELRALQADSDTGGGFTYADELFSNQLIQAVDNLVYIRQWATKMQVVGADGLGVPSLDADPADPTWTSELSIGSEDSTMAFGKRELKPHPLAQFIKISRKLIRHSAIGIEALVQARLAYKFAVVEENAYLNGTGAMQPLGVFVASANGISTGRDMSTDNTTTAITVDNLKNVKYTLKGQYWSRAKWLFHTDAIKMISKLKDGEGRYLWAESIRAGEPDTLLGFATHSSEYAPNTFTTGLYVGILGDFSNYWIADSMAMSVQALFELYAATNQVGYIGRLESDGMPVLEEAFVRVKLG